jgi:predicted RNA-binding protein YlqC (UPF0109 family)
MQENLKPITMTARVVVSGGAYMKELLEYLIKSLVDYPDEVEVQPVEGERTVIFEVRVAPDDMGKVIGKHGKIANALRTILKAAATKDGKKVSMEIIS